MEILFVNPGNSSKIYQGLSRNLSAIEPPTWALLLAEATRSKGYETGILDVNAENLDVNSAYRKIEQLKPRLICFVVYGQNVNAGTASMSGAVELANYIKAENNNLFIGIIGSYVQALPKKVLSEEKSFDLIFTNEGVISILELLSQKNFDDKSLMNVSGVAFRNSDNKFVFTQPGKIVASNQLDHYLPGYAWDLLPYKESPLDIYRAPLWHAEYQEEFRSPYAAIQTSLGCNFGCSFCMINIINRNDNEEVGVASNYKGMRFWSTQHNLKQFDILNKLGVKTIRIVDEMFLLYKKHYVPLCEELATRDYAKELRMWSYSRIDTVTDPEFLKVVRSAGIRWLALGIESATKSVRLEVSKGKFEDVDIEKVIGQVHSAGIEVMANYIAGLPGETKDSMARTIELAKKLNTSGWNMYAAMALPGSELYKIALERGYPLPSSYTGYSFHSEDTLPLPTNELTAAEILKFRDDAFLDYHTDQNFLDRIKKKYGEKAVESIIEMTKIKLKRDLFK
jgi:radical SAM superfamily enzyme YgiQ (UPF0313 family)